VTVSRLFAAVSFAAPDVDKRFALTQLPQPHRARQPDRLAQHPRGVFPVS
jgi:hypothetical protein